MFRVGGGAYQIIMQKDSWSSGHSVSAMLAAQLSVACEATR